MPDEVVATPFGKFLVDDRDVIESTLKAGTLWDGPGFLQPIAIEYGRLGEPGVTILDVGAHVGSFSIWLCQQGAWRVVAVEPVKATVERLKANLDLNRELTAGRVLVVDQAAYDRECWLAPDDGDYTGNSGGTALVYVVDPLPKIVVRATRLDLLAGLYGRGVSLVKVDAQGCDAKAILGLEQTIHRFHPAIVFEWEDELARRHHTYLGDLFRWLEARGYEILAWPSRANDYLARPVEQPTW